MKKETAGQGSVHLHFSNVVRVGLLLFYVLGAIISFNTWKFCKQNFDWLL